MYILYVNNCLTCVFFVCPLYRNTKFSRLSKPNHWATTCLEIHHPFSVTLFHRQHKNYLGTKPFTHITMCRLQENAFASNAPSIVHVPAHPSCFLKNGGSRRGRELVYLNSGWFTAVRRALRVLSDAVQHI